MGRWPSIQSRFVPTAVLSPVVASLLSVLSQFPAQSLKFPPVQDRSAPSITSGGGTRGPSCIEKEPVPLLSLTPTRNNWGKTVNPNPSLYWYLPPTTATVGEFELSDAEGNQVLISEFDLPAQPGVIVLRLPPTVALAVDQNYEWYFSIVCDADDRSQDMYVQGSLQRTAIEPNLETQLANTQDPLQRAQLYAQQGIWFDALSLVAGVRNEHPAEWEELLLSVDLPEQIAKAEIRDVQISPAASVGTLPSVE